MLDAVICDIRMPKINGLEALVYFRHAYSHVPLIVLTGNPDTEMAISCLREGLVDYLVKPVDGKRLKAAGGKAMERREWDTLESTSGRKEGDFCGSILYIQFGGPDPMPLIKHMRFP